ncbi:MAG: carbohydrate binding domain-containing protein [Victivallaceae bacterium]|nr:carbohydrate binding domain-containing protein [Victivallaceae bacterium]
MKKIIKCSLTVVVVVAVIATVLSADNLIENGSFEEKGSCLGYDMLLKKGFTLNFKKADWTKIWVINNASHKGEITLVDAKDAPDGEKYLQIKKATDTHVYPNVKLPGEFKYDVTFYAKAPTGNNKLYVYTYLYKVEKTKYITSKLIKKITLSDKWQKFSVVISEYGDDKLSMLALGVKGDCDLDNLTVNMKE